ncbi:MAG TPA: NAD(P)H-hydrate dehydratase [Patescibacteria group bacterium]|nr:NAD(P)H-hydrate dehydratase [Patescibacteria group bacterium]
MQEFDTKLLKQLYVPPTGSHKGQNGKLLLIGGSHLFHASTLWALDIASKIVDMVFYASVPENNEIVQKTKEEFRNGIVIQQIDLEHYINEADAILIGPGMERTESKEARAKSKEQKIEEILNLEDEGEKTYFLTKYLLQKYPQKKWIIDAGALQMLEPEWLKPLNGNAVLTPHKKEFERVFGGVIPAPRPSEALREGGKAGIQNKEDWILNQVQNDNIVANFAKKYNCTVLLKGPDDIVCSSIECCRISGGNAGMTKGGTGDVLAGLVAALATKNDLYLSACVGSFINKKAGEKLFEKVGYYFNSSDLVSEIPQVMKELLNI